MSEFDQWIDDDLFLDENGEPICERSDADAIIQKASIDLKAIFLEKVKNLLQQAKEAKSQLEKIKMDIFWKEQHLQKIESDLKEANEKAEHLEKYEMPRKYINAFVREATGNYAPGDKVFYIKSVFTKRKCPVCQGRKKVDVIFQEKPLSVSCPSCKGEGVLYDTHEKAEESEVEQVNLKLCFKSNRVSYWNTECVYIYGYDFSVNPERLFRTKEEAEAKIKEKLEEKKDG